MLGQGREPCKPVERRSRYTRVQDGASTTGFNDLCLGVCCLVLLLLVIPGLLLVGLLQADRSLQIQTIQTASSAHTVSSAHAAHAAQRDPPSRLRLLQQNCWTPLFGSGGDKADRMKALVEAAGEYDVLILQEVFGSWLGWRQVLGYAPTLVHDLESRGFTHFLTSRPSFLQLQDSGLMIASKFPLENPVEVDFQDWTLKEAWTSKGALGVRIAGTNLTIVNTHLNAYNGTTERDVRHAQLVQLKNKLLEQPSKADVVISGDLNVNLFSHNCSNSEVNDMLDLLGPLAPPFSPLREAREVCSLPPTWPSDRPTRRYNYMLHHRPERWSLGPVGRVTIGSMKGPGFSGVSDHLGIFAELLKL